VLKGWLSQVSKETEIKNYYKDKNKGKTRPRTVQEGPEVE
jgi:hypothetical protein